MQIIIRYWIIDNESKSNQKDNLLNTFLHKVLNFLFNDYIILYCING